MKDSGFRRAAGLSSVLKGGTHEPAVQVATSDLTSRPRITANPAKDRWSYFTQSRLMR